MKTVAELWEKVRADLLASHPMGEDALHVARALFYAGAGMTAEEIAKSHSHADCLRRAVDLGYECSKFHVEAAGARAATTGPQHTGGR